MNIEMIDIEEPIRLGYADIIYRGSDGIIIHELRSHALMISMNNREHLLEIYEKNHLNQFHLILVKEESIKDILIKQYHKTLQFACFQAVYTKKDKINIFYPQNVSIHNLTMNHYQLVKECYEHSQDVEHLKDIIKRGHLWGLFENKELAGFIGIHDEGSMGILEVREKYKRKGYGSLLESYLINVYLDQGLIPFCQVIENNQPSLSLQKKLGLKISNDLSYWLG